jgi:hypothetical protein
MSRWEKESRAAEPVLDGERKAKNKAGKEED